jgi:hypothetical protein
MPYSIVCSSQTVIAVLKRGQNNNAAAITFCIDEVGYSPV